MPKFIRTDYMRSLKLGKKNKKLRVWRKAKGRHSKIRRKRKGYPLSPSIGFKKPSYNAGKINGLKPILVHNTKELMSLNKKEIAIIAKVGARKKLEILKKADEIGASVLNSGGKK